MAISIGGELLQERLIACYNLFPVASAYWWKGKLLEEQEVMMFMKTKEEHFDKISEFIKNYSDYEIPEVIAVSPEKVNLPYLTWVEDETKSAKIKQ